MPPTDIFRRLPPPTVSLLLAALFSHSTAHILPRQTTALPHRTLAVEPFPLPTPHAVVARQSPNTICGFIDADPSLPVTCGAGSHCVVDQAAYVTRHGSRYPDPGAYGEWTEMESRVGARTRCVVQEVPGSTKS